MTTLSASSVSSRVVIPTGGSFIRVLNNGPALVFVKMDGTGAVAALTDVPIPVGVAQTFPIGGNLDIAGITATGLAAVTIVNIPDAPNIQGGIGPTGLRGATGPSGGPTGATGPTGP